MLEFIKSFFSNYEDEDYQSQSFAEDEYDDIEDEMPVNKAVERSEVRKTFTVDDSVSPVINSAGRRHDNVVNFAKLGTQQVVIVKPETMMDGQRVANEIRRGKVVICNFEMSEQKLSQRLIDFLSGSAFSLGGRVLPISNHIFVISPAHISMTNGLDEVVEENGMEQMRRAVNAL